jgi:phosphopantothenoylcysteine decarboxylase/phosphopantothenate--cysteine ligase
MEKTKGSGFLRNKNVLLGVTGGISAYKACEMLRLLMKEGANVNVVMTKNAEKFVSKMTFQYLSGNKVFSNMYDDTESDISHINLADTSDLILICPATANFISKYSHGIADNLLLNILLATKSSVTLCPAMNVNMYDNPIIQENMKRLIKLGISIIEPDSGELACGWEGKGRLADLDKILHMLKKKNLSSDLENEKILITCGATREYLDPIRFISNPSSGKMGIALAQVLGARGAEIKVVHGHLEESLPSHLESIKCESVEDMEKEIFSDLKDFTVIIKAAAVGDYKFKTTRRNKLKKSRSEVSFEMEKTTDILNRIGKEKESSQILIGFSAETKNTVKNSKKKIKDKNLDLIVANDVSIENSGFGQDNNFTYLVSRSNEVEELGLISKRNLSIKIGDYIKKIRMELPER